MKKNIALVGIDRKFIKNFALNLAKKLKMNYADADELFESDLVSTSTYPVGHIDAALDRLEKNELTTLNKKQNYLFSISADMYLSDKNYHELSNCIVILIQKKDSSYTEKNIEKLINKHCSLMILNENLTIEAILALLRGENE